MATGKRDNNLFNDICSDILPVTVQGASTLPPAQLEEPKKSVSVSEPSKVVTEKDFLAFDDLVPPSIATNTLSTSSVSSLDTSGLMEMLSLLDSKLTKIYEALNKSTEQESPLDVVYNGKFTIPKVATYPFRFLQFQRSGNLFSLVVDPEDFSLNIAPGTDVILEIPFDIDNENNTSSSLNLRVLTSGIGIKVSQTKSVNLILLWSKPTNNIS